MRGRAILLLLATVLFADGEAAQQEVWIARRADGRPGSGSAADPYDGSTSARLDPVLRRALDVANTRVHFGPGTFYTKSVLAPDPVAIRQPYVSVVGAGMYRTVLALDPAVSAHLPAWAFSVLQTDQHITQNSHLTVQDLTVDAGWPQLQNPRRDIAIGNVSLTGSYCSLIRVRAINAHGDHASGKEAFALNIGCGGAYDIREALVADCVVESPRGDYVNAIAVTGWTFGVYPATDARGVVRGCKVYNLRADYRHMSAYALAGGVLTDCYAENSTAAVYTEGARALTISNCTFRRNIWRGVWIFPTNNYGGVRDIKILNSTIEVSNYLEGASAIEIGKGDDRNAAEDVLISGNRILRQNVKPRNRSYSVITATDIPRLALIGNQIDRRLDNSLVRNASLIGNKSTNGRSIGALPDILIGEEKAQFLQSGQEDGTRTRPSRKQ